MQMGTWTIVLVAFIHVLCNCGLTNGESKYSDNALFSTAGLKVTFWVSLAAAVLIGENEKQ